jgi:PAS domain-containing protein
MNKEEVKYTNAQILRKKAEKLVFEKQNRSVVDSNEMDQQKLLHELQVHQIELEMQNEELLNEVEMVEKILKKNALLFDLAPMGYFTLDATGKIFELNQAGARMLRDNSTNLINANFKIFVVDKARTAFESFIKSAFQKGEKVSCKVMLEKDKKPLCYVYLEGLVIPEDQKLLLSVVNISGNASAHDYQIPIF